MSSPIFPISEETQSSMNRRQFVATAAVAACACLVCPTSFAFAGTDGAATEAAQALIDIGATADYARDEIYDQWVKAYRFFVIRAEGTLFAVSAACPHRGVTVQKDMAEAEPLYCNAHGSAFSGTGKFIHGPARRSLPRFQIQLNAEGKIVVDLSKRFDEGEWNKAESFLKL